MLLATGTAARFTHMLGNVQQTQQELTKLQQQVSSGKQAEQFSELNVRVEVVHALESKIRRTEQYMNSNNLIKTRLEGMDNALSGLVDVATEVKNTAITARGGTNAQYPVFIQTLESLKQVVAERLNANVGDFYLFGGSKTNVPPVSVPVPEPEEEGTPDAGYYQGDGVTLTTNLSDSLQISYGVKADDIAFQKIFTAIDRAIKGMEEENDDKIAEAIDMVTDAIDGVVAIQGNITNNISILDKASARHEASLPPLQEFVSNEVDTDIPSAVAQSVLAETIIQASFQVLARVGNLRLSDFL